MATLNTQRLQSAPEAQSVAGGLSLSGSSHSPSQSMVEGQNTNVLEQMSMALAAAIQEGNVEKAQSLAKSLAHAHTRVNVIPKETRKACEPEISVTVHVEDRESAGLPLPDVKVRPSDTILDLKLWFLGKYGFPVEVQKWIIGKRICGDDETLSKCEVNTSGHTLYLYLLNARSVNISREDYSHQWQPPSGLGRASLTSGSVHRSGPASDAEVRSAPHVANQPVFSTNQDLNLPAPQGQGPSLHMSTEGAGLQQSHLSNASSSSSMDILDIQSPQYWTVFSPRIESEPSSEQQRRSEARQSEGQRGSPGERVAPEMRHGQSQRVPEVEIVAGSNQSMTSSGSGWQLGMQASSRDMHFNQPPPDPSYQGWECESCTLINQPTRPGCELCGSPRPPSYQVPSDFVISEEERLRMVREQQQDAILQQTEVREREENYQQLLQAESNDLVCNTDVFVCPICFDTIESGAGIVLRECLHQFCRSCLTDTVRLTEEAELKCPFQNDVYRCDAVLQDREVRALSEQVYERHLRRSLHVAESQASNSYHCKTPDCHGWCLYEDLVNFFRCPVCCHENCLTCRAIHEDMDCKQYQEDLHIRAANDEAAQQTQSMIKDMLDKGEAMPCPQCQVIVQKKDGCDWIRCSICKTEICWVTKGPRWGPKGEGDLSGGCKCRLKGRKCHPKCNNCH